MSVWQVLDWALGLDPPRSASDAVYGRRAHQRWLHQAESSNSRWRDGALRRELQEEQSARPAITVYLEWRFVRAASGMSSTGAGAEEEDPLEWLFGTPVLGETRDVNNANYEGRGSSAPRTAAAPGPTVDLVPTTILQSAAHPLLSTESAFFCVLDWGAGACGLFHAEAGVAKSLVFDLFEGDGHEVRAVRLGDDVSVDGLEEDVGVFMWCVVDKHVM